MKNYLRDTKEYVRNPLGIIGLFIWLVYGVISIVMPFMIESLPLGLKIALISFIIIYPILILLAFLCLVIKHPTKLYGPKDYRNDSSFLKAIPLSIKEKNEKVKQEIVEQEENQEKQSNITNSEKYVERPKNVNYAEQKKNYMLLEDIALRKLESERKMLINRQVKITLGNSFLFWADGIGTKNNLDYIIEVKVIKGSTIPYSTISQLKRFIDTISNLKDKYRLIMVIVHEKGYGKEIQQKLFNVSNQKLDFVSYVYYTKDMLYKEFDIPPV